MRIPLALAPLLLACGGATATTDAGMDAPASGMTSGMGTFGGQPFAPVDAVFDPSVPTTAYQLFGPFLGDESPSLSGTMASLVISADPHACTSFAVGNATNALQIFVLLFAVDASGHTTAPSAPGTYTIVAPAEDSTLSGNVAIVLAGSCGVSTGYLANQGSITITSLSATEMSGSFDVTVGTTGYGQGSGTFNAAACAQIATRYNGAC